MATYLTYDYLKRNSAGLKKMAIANESATFQKHAFAQKNDITTVFLSHKHEDKEIVEEVKGFFASQGANIYIDWQDKDLPEVTSVETAEKLKQKIKQSQKFIVLATAKSIESIWMPWEIGLADTLKSLSNIAILPLVVDSNRWDKREYYRLYNTIQDSGSGWYVATPNGNYISVLNTWLKS